MDGSTSISPHDPCIICGRSDAALLYATTYSGSLAEASSFFLAGRSATAHGDIVRCRGCAFVFTSPRFAPEDYARIYAGIGALHEDDHAGDAAASARFRRLADAVKRYAPKGSEFLDFGCGAGGFLKVMDDPRGRGFEIGSPGERIAGRSTINVGDWTTYAGSTSCPPNSLNYVTAFDVFEHLPRLEADVARIRTVLKPNGLLFVTVPNVESAVAKMMGKRWNMLLLEHLWYFSPVTLDRFMARLGFKAVATRSVPFDAPLSHIATRMAQTFGLTKRVTLGPLDRMVLPTPAGIMLSVYRATPSSPPGEAAV